MEIDFGPFVETDVREAWIAKNGLWQLRVESDAWTMVVLVLKKLVSAEVLDVRKIKATLPGSIMIGTFPEMRLLSFALSQKQIRALVERVETHSENRTY
jgi:hypothetical protein